MNTYLVSYDLMSPGQNYPRLIQQLQRYPNWAKVLESVWLIQTPDSAEQVRNVLRTVTDLNDKLFVIKASAPAAWYNLDPQIDKWLKSSL